MKIVSLDRIDGSHGDADFITALRCRPCSDHPVEQLAREKLIEAVALLSAHRDSLRGFAFLNGREVEIEVLPLGDNQSGHVSRIRLEVDWFDRAPLTDGFPPLHFRIAIDKGSRSHGRDTRRETAQEAVERILSAFDQ